MNLFYPTIPLINYKSTNNKMSQSMKCCKVCKDAGKPESVYRSHFPRETPDPNSRVVCPTLLATICTCCGKKGHTVKYCRVNLCSRSRSLYEEKKPNKNTYKPNNRFEHLNQEKEKEKEQEPEKPRETKITYASVLAKEAPIPRDKPFELISVQTLKEQCRKPPRDDENPLPTKPIYILPRKNWYEDEEEDDYEDDDEYEEETKYEYECKYGYEDDDFDNDY